MVVYVNTLRTKAMLKLVSHHHHHYHAYEWYDHHGELTWNHCD